MGPKSLFHLELVKNAILLPFRGSLDLVIGEEFTLQIRWVMFCIEFTKELWESRIKKDRLGTFRTI